MISGYMLTRRLQVSLLTFTTFIAMNLSQKASARTVDENVLSARESIEALAVVLHAWNPSLSEQAIARELIIRVESVGIRKGLLGPAVTLIDISYVANVPGLSALVLPTITRFAPDLAQEIGYRLRIDPTFSPEDRPAQGRLGLPQFRSQLHAIIGNPKRNRLVTNNPFVVGMGQWDRRGKKSNGLNALKSGDVISNLITGPSSYFHKKRSPGYSPERGGLTQKAPRRGPLSNMDEVAYVECAARCAADAFEHGANGMATIGALGALIGLYTGGPAGATKGAFIGGGIGAGIGVAVGINECRKSSECGGVSPSEPKSNDVPKKEDPPKKEDTPKKDNPPKAESSNESDDEKEKKKKKDKNPKAGESGTGKGNSFPRRDDYQDGDIGEPVDPYEVRRQKLDPVVNPHRGYEELAPAGAAIGAEGVRDDRRKEVIIYSPYREIDHFEDDVDPDTVLKETRDPWIFPANPHNANY